ncbi:MAG TPA: hypothetical protein VLB87_06905, partial [Pyrinomonadaceae bacterium]|nr:hypothetical protein [Pyrinomonadaceae bacterium]
MKALFGTDGIRGEAGRFPLDAATVSTIGFSLGNHLAETVAEPVIVIGRDTRESGEWIERALTEGAARAGAKCLSAGVITTPGVAYLTRHLNAHAGVVISASHNPYQDNGIKIFSPSGEKIDDSLERQIERDVYHGSKTQFEVIHVPLAVAGLRDDYLDFLTNDIGKNLSLKTLKIVVDCANGA